MTINKFFELTSGYSLTFLRIWLGGAMMWYSFPILFLGGLEDFSNYSESLGIPMAAFLSPVAKCFEFFGGLMVLTGFYSRIGALGIASVMLVAFGVAHDFKIFTEGGISFNLFVMSVTIVLGGPGNFSLSSLPAKYKKDPH